MVQYAIRFDDGERPMRFYSGPDEALKALEATGRAGEVGVMGRGQVDEDQEPVCADDADGEEEVA